MNIVYVKTEKELNDLGSALTFVGVDPKYIDNIINWMNSHGSEFIGSNVYITKGKDMNRIDNLHGSNSYQDDLNIISFDLKDIRNFNNLIIPRFEVGGRWLDDIRDNNKRRELERAS